jgi:integrase
VDPTGVSASADQTTVKPPRIYARGDYFWIRYYLPGQKNEVRESTQIPLDPGIKIPEPKSRDYDWWKKSKSSAKLKKKLDDITFSREASSRGIELDDTPDIPPIDALLEEFNAVNAEERDRERAGATILHRETALKFFKSALKGKPWYQINRQWVLDLRKSSKANYAPSSIRGYFVVLKMLMTYAVREGYIPVNPFEGISVIVPKKSPNKVSNSEERTLFTFLYHKNRALFYQALFQRLTGLRASDVCKLKKKDMQKDGTLTYFNSKAHRIETVPLSAATRQLLRSMPANESEWLFEFRHIRTMVYYMQRASEFAGVQHIHTHQLKRSYMQELAKAKPDARTFDLLAHHAPTVNQVAVNYYAGKDLDLMREALEAAQAEWIGFLKELPTTKGDEKEYRFSNGKGKSRESGRTVDVKNKS